MARVSSDHADESMNVAHLSRKASGPRLVSPAELAEHDGRAGGSGFWAVVDGFVVDASEFVDSHPGGLKKLMSTNSPNAGATGQSFGFSFTRGKNAHFPDTGRRFAEGVKRYLGGQGGDIAFPPHGTLVIVGKLAK